MAEVEMLHISSMESLDSPGKRLLRDHEVHLWRSRLDLPASNLERMRSTLSDDEQQRARNYAFDKDRHRFIAARGILRRIVGHYLHCEPSEVRFERKADGKPCISPFLGAALEFNVSHAEGLAIYAITWNRRIGVDIERVRADFAYEEIAKNFFSRQELASLRRLPVKLQREAFYNCWTRKEAYLKARGDGLSASLDNFEVSLIPGDVAALLSCVADQSEITRWHFTHLRPAPGYLGALVVEGVDLNLIWLQ